MQRSKAIKLAGFVGALAASATLVSVSVSGTGAYFTDSHAGSVSAGTGSVKINTSNTNLDFGKLLPGQYDTRNIDYQAAGSGNEDIWMVFPSTGAEALGVPGNPNQLGRYGHFQVDSNAGSFVSNNLGDVQPGDPGDHCGVDANGHGGDSRVASYAYQGAPRSTLTELPYCAPHAILLDSNVAPGAGGTVRITFGFTQALRSGQDAPSTNLAAFQIVATQTGIRPDDVNNG